MNTYDLSRYFFDFAANNPDIIKPVHGMLYFYIVDLNNRLGWKEKFALPSYNTMSTIGVSNYKTYSKALDELVTFKLIKIVQKSKNQHTACVVALVKNTKALSKHCSDTVEANTKASLKQSSSTVVIDKPINNTKQEEEVKQNTSSSTSFLSLKDCRLQYDKDYVDAKLKLCETHNVLHKNLSILQNVFDGELLVTGKKEKTMIDYVDHFAKWLNYKGIEGRKQIVIDFYKSQQKEEDFTAKYRQ